ncbi:hypothetical protein NK356_14350 [Chryseobacterium sp. S0630]|uniref:hypothetical protein n=1 Tax=Chryseobacterium sp. S0630 TaxID=2957803 RepID=UPI0005514249|nr:hypothetical protein [Chryseobacterium sp. S0630]MCP1300356.1 hypothetical protein [Chryseobacterium sp. S0630]
MKTFLFIILIIINSCTKKEITQDQIIETYPQKEVVHNPKTCEISEIPIASVFSINPIFYKLIGYKKILIVESVQKNTLYFSSEICIAKKLYFKKNIPIEAGKYKNVSPYQIYDFIYPNERAVKIAFENIKFELKKISTQNNYEYFDYFNGVSYVYFLALDKKKITTIRFSAVNGINEYNKIIDFCKKNKNTFQEIIFVDATGAEKIK